MTSAEVLSSVALCGSILKLVSEGGYLLPGRSGFPKALEKAESRPKGGEFRSSTVSLVHMPSCLRVLGWTLRHNFSLAKLTFGKFSSEDVLKLPDFRR